MSSNYNFEEFDELYNTDNLTTLRSDILGSKRVLKMLGDVKNKRILDLGCGNGNISRQLSRKGAQVTGIDLISKKINQASNIERRRKQGIAYLVGNIASFDNLSLPYKKYDIILSLMVHLYLRKNLFINSFSSIKRILEKNGKFYYLSIHPGRVLFEKPESNYFHNNLLSTVLNVQGSHNIRTIYYNYPLEMILNSMINSGLIVKSICEPVASAKELIKYPNLLKGTDSSPYYLIIEASLT